MNLTFFSEGSVVLSKKMRLTVKRNEIDRKSAIRKANGACVTEQTGPNSECFLFCGEEGYPGGKPSSFDAIFRQ